MGSLNDPHESVAPDALVKWLTFDGFPAVLAVGHTIPFVKNKIQTIEPTVIRTATVI
jgi:hypothetical protein